MNDEVYLEERLRPLKTYKYQGMDRSFISRYVLTPYWNWVVTYMPLWLAPNMITLLGFGFMLFALLLVLLFTPDLVGPTSSIIYFTFAACIWIYSTLDNVDGKQARRTNTSSPLGELFDHGCDSLNCSIGALVQIAGMALGTSWYSDVVFLMLMWAFYLPTWEEYHTGVLYLGVINGPTEGLIISCLIMVVSGLLGPQIWSSQVSQLCSIPGEIGNLLVKDLLIIIFSVLLVCYVVPSSILTVYTTCRRRNTSFLVALSQLGSMVVGSLAAAVWLWSPYSAVRAHLYIPFLLTLGVVFGKMATKIILAHLTKAAFPYCTALIVPLIVGAALINLPAVFPRMRILAPTMEALYIYAYLLGSLVAYLNWAYHVINAFCGYLDINCLTIKPRRQPTSRRAY